MRYIEIRGTADVEDDPTCAMRDRVAAKHGYEGAAFDPLGTVRVQIHITPTKVIEH
jgi:hypothetical protein